MRSISGIVRQRLEMNRMAYSVSATTRKPRQGEEDGVHYFFKTVEEFERMIGAGELAEYNSVHGNWYGTPRGPVDAILMTGNHVVLDLDVNVLQLDVGGSRLEPGFSVGGPLAKSKAWFYVAYQPTLMTWDRTVNLLAGAFLLSELADFAVYTPLQRKGLVIAVLASSLVGLIADSVA